MKHFFPLSEKPNKLDFRRMWRKINTTGKRFTTGNTWSILID